MCIKQIGVKNERNCMRHNYNDYYREANFGRGGRDFGHGRGRGMHGHGGPKGGSHRGPRNRRNHFQLEAALLVLLAEEASYGYQLMESLKAFYNETFNSSVLYRKLVRMEEMGLVVSTVDETDSKGPARRMYEITDGGKVALKDWVDLLKKRQEQLARLLTRAEDIL